MQKSLRARQLGIRQRSVVPKYGRATVLVFVVASGAAVILPETVQAQDLTWDTTAGDTAVVGGSGSWDTATTNWTTDAGNTNQTWTPAGNANFGGTAGTVTVEGLQEVSNITFNTDGYVLNGGSHVNDQIRLVAGAGEIAVTTGTATLNVSISDAGVAASDVIKTGSGTLVMGGIGLYWGDTVVQEGTLQLTNTFAIVNTSGTVQVDAGATLQVSASNTINGFAGSGETVIDAGRTLSTGMNGSISVYGGVISGAGNLQSFGDLTLSGDSTYTGVTTVAGNQVTLTGSIASTDIRILANANVPASMNIAGNGDAVADTATINNAGTLVLTGNDERVGSVFGAGNINLNDNTLTTGDATNVEISGIVSGTGNLTKQGSGTLTLSGTNTATGTLTNNEGTTVVSGTWAGNVANNATFDLTGTSTVNGTFTNNSTGSITNSGAGTVSLTGLSNFISGGAIGSATGTVTVNTVDMTYRDGHSETGTVTFNVSDTITEERTSGPTWQGTGYTSNFATAVGGVFTTGGDFTTTGGFTHDSTAALTVSTGDTMTVASLTNTAGSVINVQTDASLVGTGNTTNNSGTVNVAGGGSLVEETGDYNNLSAGIVNFNDTAVKTFDVQDGVISNAGVLNFNAGTTDVNSGGGAIQNTATGDINIANNATLNATGDTINNAGSIDMLGAGSVLTVDTLTNQTGGTVNARGTLNGDVVNTGSGDFNASGTLTGIGSFTNEGTATFDVTGTATVGSLTNTTTGGSGTSIATFGTLYVTGAIENGVSGGTNASVITNNWNLIGRGTLTNYAGATLNSNTITSALFATDVTNNGTMNIQGRMDVDSITNSGSGATFTVVGNTYGGGAPSSTSPSPTPVGSFLNEAGATLNVTTGEIELSTLTNTSAGTGTTLATAGVQVQVAGIIDAASVANTGTGTINNAGTIRATTITNGDGTNAATLTNSGTLTTFATTGTGLSNAAGSTLVSTGTIDADASNDAAAILNAGIADLSGLVLGNLTNTGSLDIEGQLIGDLRSTAGQVTINGDVDGVTIVTGGNLFAQGGNFTGGVQMTGGAMQVQGDTSAAVTNAGGLVQIDSGTTLTGDIANNSGTTIVNGTLAGTLDVVGGSATVTATGAVNDTVGVAGGTFTAQGGTYGNGITVTGGTTNVTGAITMAGGTVTSDDGYINISATGVVNGDVVSMNSGGPATARIDNNGTINGTATANAGIIVNYGTVTGEAIANGGELANSGALQDGFTVNGGLLTLFGAGTIAGAGTVNSGGAFLVNGGTFSDGVDNEGGVIEIAGNSTGVIRNNDGSARIDPTVTFNGDVINGADGTFNLSTIGVGTATIDGTLANNGGNVNLNGTITGGTTNTGATAQITVAAGDVANFGTTPGMTNSGGGTLTIIGSTTGTINNEIGSTVELSGVMSGAFNNSGDLLFIGNAGPGDANRLGGLVTNNLGGNIVLQSGQLTFGNGLINNGLVDVSNGAPAGDLIDVQGGLSGNGTFALDIDLTTDAPVTDRVVISGDTTGAFALQFSPVAGPLVFFDAPLLVLDVDEGATNAFTFSSTGLPTGSGPISVLATQAVPNGDVSVMAVANISLGGYIDGIAQVEGFTMQEAGRLSSQTTCDGVGGWAQATAVEISTRSMLDNGGQSTDLDTTMTQDGIAVGANLGCIEFSGATQVGFGMLGGLNTGTSEQLLSGDTPIAMAMDYEQHFAGLQASLTRGALSADVQLRFAQTEYTFDKSAGSEAEMMGLTDDTVTAETAGLAADVSYRMPLGAKGFSVVPQAGFTVSRTSVGDLGFDGGQTLSTSEYTTFTGKIGTTVDYEYVSADGQNQLSAFAGAHYNSAFSEGQSMTLQDGFGGESGVTSSGVDGYTEIGLGFDYTRQIDEVRSFNVALSANGAVSENVDGYSVGLEVGVKF